MARRTPDPRERCVCGHVWAAHEHYRKGTDCALCPAGDCDWFRPTGALGPADA
jgi:hypothetical protein